VLNKNGVLIVSEKIHFDDKQKQDEITKLHLDFKRANGYSELEIANKRLQLKLYTNFYLAKSLFFNLKKINRSVFLLGVKLFYKWCNLSIIIFWF
jgi:tRNA (cmo5U34)-methyltransferase